MDVNKHLQDKRFRQLSPAAQRIVLKRILSEDQKFNDLSGEAQNKVVERYLSGSPQQSKNETSREGWSVRNIPKNIKQRIGWATPDGMREMTAEEKRGMQTKILEGRPDYSRISPRTQAELPALTDKEARESLSDFEKKRKSQRGFLQAVKGGAEQSAIGTLATGEESDYEPQNFLEKVTSGVTSILADTPVYAAISAASGGNPAAVFGGHSVIKRLADARARGEIPENFTDKENQYLLADLARDVAFEGVTGAASGYLMSKAGRLIGGAGSKVYDKALKRALKQGMKRHEAINYATKQATRAMGASSVPLETAAMSAPHAAISGELNTDDIIKSMSEVAILKALHKIPAKDSIKKFIKKRRTVKEVVENKSEIIEPEKLKEVREQVARVAVEEKENPFDDSRLPLLTEKELKPIRVENDYNAALKEARRLGLKRHEAIDYATEKARETYASEYGVKKKEQGLREEAYRVESAEKISSPGKVKNFPHPANPHKPWIEEVIEKVPAQFKHLRYSKSPKTQEKMTDAIDQMYDNIENNFTGETIQGFLLNNDIKSLVGISDQRILQTKNLTDVQKQKVIDGIERRFKHFYGENPKMEKRVTRVEVYPPEIENKPVSVPPPEGTSATPPKGVQEKLSPRWENIMEEAADFEAAKKQKTIESKIEKTQEAFKDEKPVSESKNESVKISDENFINELSKSVAESILPNNINVEQGKISKIIESIDGKFISSVGKYISKNTDAGKKLVNKCVEFRAIRENMQGGIENKFFKSIESFSKNKKINTIQTEHLVNLLDTPREKLIDAVDKIKLPEKYKNEIVLAHDKIRSLFDWMVEEARNTGLKQYNKSVEFWSIRKTNSGYSIHNRVGEKIGDYKSRADAERYKESSLYTDVKKLDGYVPHIIKPEVFKNQKLMDELVDHLVTTGQIILPKDKSNLPKAQAEQLLRRLARMMIDNGMNLNEMRHKNIQNERQFEIPEKFLRRDLGIFTEYIENFSDRIVKAKMFGIHEEGLYNMAVEVAAEATARYGRDKAEIQWRRALALANHISGRFDKHNETNALTNMIMNVFTVTKLTTAAIGQIPQFFAAGWRLGPKALVKGMAFSGKAEYKEFVRRCGVNLESTRNQIIRTAGDSQFVKSYMKKIGFVRADAKARAIAAVAGKFYAEEISKKVLKNYYAESGKIYKNGKEVPRIKKGAFSEYTDSKLRALESLDINPVKLLEKGYLPEKWVEFAARKAEVDTNFRADYMDLPEFRNSNIGRIVTQFKTFMYSNTKLIKDHVYKEARYGNFRPLAMLILLSVPGGLMSNDLKGIVTGRASSLRALIEDDEYADFFIDSISAAGTLGILEMAMQTYKYQDPQAGVAFSTLMKGLHSLSRISAADGAGKKFDAASDFIIGELPLGSRWKRTKKMIKNSDDWDAIDLLTLPQDKQAKKKARPPLRRNTAESERAKIRRKYAPKY